MKRLVVVAAVEVLVVAGIVLSGASKALLAVPMVALVYEVYRLRHPPSARRRDDGSAGNSDQWGSSDQLEGTIRIMDHRDHPAVLEALAAAPARWLDIDSVDAVGEQWNPVEDVLQLIGLGADGDEWDVGFSEEINAYLDLRRFDGEDEFENTLLADPDVDWVDHEDAEAYRWHVVRPVDPGAMCALVVRALTAAYLDGLHRYQRHQAGSDRLPE